MILETWYYLQQWQSLCCSITAEWTQRTNFLLSSSQHQLTDFLLIHWFIFRFYFSLLCSLYHCVGLLVLWMGKESYRIFPIQSPPLFVLIWSGAFSQSESVLPCSFSLFHCFCADINLTHCFCSYSHRSAFILMFLYRQLTFCLSVFLFCFF